MRGFRTVVLAMCALSIQGYIVNPGPAHPATKGYVWPKPQNQISTEEFFSINSQAFKIELEGAASCNLLYNAFRRYMEIVQNLPPLVSKDSATAINLHSNYTGELEKLVVSLNGICDDSAYPVLFMDEAYSLSIADGAGRLSANSVWGVLRGLETFSQLLYLGSDKITTVVNSTEIEDYPRYSHRGLLLDTSRHFIPLQQIYQVLDGMAYNKLNVFHWHIVDDQSFPYVSLQFPELSDAGAYHPQILVYSPDDVASVIEYARQRGIRVVPEFDTPGHTRSWGVSHPELLTPCDSVEVGSYGPMDPTKDVTYTFVNNLFTELRRVFQDQFIHLGGDEVDFDCWEYDNNIKSFMESMNITSYSALESYYIQKIVNIADHLNFSSIVWEEVFKNGVNIPENTIVHVWRDWESSYWRDTMYDVTNDGKRALLSACWYLDHLKSGGDWQTFYECEPTSFNGDEEQQKLLLGGETCMWSEVVNEYNVVQRIFPRASSPAEKLWSALDSNYDVNFLARRLEEHVCRMNRRGVPAQPPTAAGFCL